MEKISIMELIDYFKGILSKKIIPTKSDRQGGVFEFVVRTTRIYHFFMHVAPNQWSIFLFLKEKSREALNFDEECLLNTLSS